MRNINDPKEVFARLQTLALPADQTVGADAAVLVPLVQRPQPALLFTTRSLHLSRHPGQVCFPGGMREDKDDGFAATALREMYEETGIFPAFVTVLGHLSPVRTLYGQIIVPVLALLREGVTLTPNAEVTEIFEVPLTFFFDPANRQETIRQAENRVWQYYVYCYKNHRIEGATAAIVADLADRLSS